MSAVKGLSVANISEFKITPWQDFLRHKLHAT